MGKDKVGELRLAKVRSDNHFKTGILKYAEVPAMRAFAPDCDLDLAAKACCDPQGWANAVGMLEAVADKGRQSGSAKALYVIGVEGRDDVAKIGVSANPLKRVAEMQGSHYRRLYLHAIAFSPLRRAVKIEQMVLDCKQRMEGEWLELSPEEVLHRALKTAVDNRIGLIDGQTYFEDMVQRTRALAKATKFRKAA